MRRPDQYADCDALAVAPFVVKATYRWHLGPLIGEAGTYYYLWFGGSMQIVGGPTIIE